MKQAIIRKELSIRIFVTVVTALAIITVTSSCANAVKAQSTTASTKVIPAPAPYGPTPSKRQLQWQRMEFYGFVHFTVNTFTNKEWGYGNENPDVFNPTDFSADQIVATAKMAGMKGVILTCKHHDGFCLWPSKYTKHSVKYSKWMNGKGDVVRAISNACKKYGLKFGVYLSPWDRNRADYGKPSYVQYYRNQMRELLTEYGPVFEMWWDGANGGTGYYGGARENRRIDRGKYYGWPTNIKIVRHLQPNCVIFSDAGPDIRWVGNERGQAGDPCWETYTPHARKGETTVGPGTTISKEATNGQRNGKYWMPAECDVSIRPGWFYHPSQDSRVRSPQNLVNLFYASVGRGASFLLNIPPDRRGRINDADIKSLKGFRHIIDTTFAVNIAKKATLKASNIRGNSSQFGTANLLDGNRDTYWSCDDGIKQASLTAEFQKPITFNVVDIREYLPLGQRVDTWALDSYQNGKWREFARGQAIGARRLWRGKTAITTTKIRLRLTGPVCPAISEFGLYAEPAK